MNSVQINANKKVKNRQLQDQNLKSKEEYFEIQFLRVNTPNKKPFKGIINPLSLDNYNRNNLKV